MITCGEPQIGEAEVAAVSDVLRSGRLTRGDECQRFEEALRDELNVRGVLAVSSGTAAMHLALLAVGVQPGDEVIVPATTFVATANAVLYCRAKPVIVDVDRKTGTIDVAAVQRAMTKKTKAIVPVHLYGVPANVGALMLLCDDHYCRTGREVAIVEDAAEALGATHMGRAVGAIGDAAALSFYGSKTITTGEGGAVVFHGGRVGLRAWFLHGQAQSVTQRYWHECVGFNYRMTEVQAALGRVQLDRLGVFLDQRRQVFNWYDELLPETFERQSIGESDTHGCWAYAVVNEYRGEMDAAKVAERMLAAGVETRPVFFPLSRMPHFRGAALGEPYVAHRLHKHGLVLPTHCGLTREDVEKVCHELRKAASSL
jgi:perosamine synthetase